MRRLIEEMQGVASLLTQTEPFAAAGRSLERGLSALAAATEALAQREASLRLPSATAYLKLAGDVIGGWVLGKHALAAAVAVCDPAWANSKTAMLDIYVDEVLSQSPGLSIAIVNPIARLNSLDPQGLQA